MTPHQTAALALRLSAIWLGLQALGYLPWFFNMNGQQSLYVYVYTTFMLTLYVLIILMFWFFPRTVAGKLLPSQETQAEPPATADTWLAMGCTLIGLWTLTNTLPRLVYFLYLNHSTDAPWWADSELLYVGGKLVIAVWLVLGGRGVGKIFRWAQYAAIRKDL